MKYLLNGKIIKEQELVISGKDLGLLRGFAVFDFLVTYNNKPFKLDSHINRLLNSAKMKRFHNFTLNLQQPYSHLVCGNVDYKYL